MIKTILLYDGKNTSAERIANSLSCLIGFARVADINEPVEKLDTYTGYCLIFNYYGVVTSGNVIRFLADHRGILLEKRVAVVGIGFSDMGFMKFLTDVGNQTGVRNIEGFFISREDQAFSIGTEIGKMMRAPLAPMPEQLLMDHIEEFINSHNTLALATMARGDIRCTPLEYMYRDGVFYIISEGGNKFRGIMDNGQISAAIFDPFEEKGPTKGLQVTGEARVVPVGCDEYMDILHTRGVSDEQLAALPVTLFLVKLLPFTYEMLDSAFAKEGYDTKQSVNTRYRQEVYEEGQRLMHPGEAAAANVASQDLSAASDGTETETGEKVDVPAADAPIEETGENPVPDDREDGQPEESLDNPTENAEDTLTGSAGEESGADVDETSEAEEDHSADQVDHRVEAGTVSESDTANEGSGSEAEASDSPDDGHETVQPVINSLPDSNEDRMNAADDSYPGYTANDNMDLNEGVVEFSDSTVAGEQTGGSGMSAEADASETGSSGASDSGFPMDESGRTEAQESLDTDAGGLTDAELNSISLSDTKKAAQFKEALHRVKRFSRRNDDGTYQ